MSKVINGTDVTLYVDNVRMVCQQSLDITVKDGVRTHKVIGMLTDVNGVVCVGGTGRAVVTIEKMIELFNNKHKSSIKYRDTFIYEREVMCESIDFSFACEEAAQYTLILRELVVNKINK